MSLLYMMRRVVSKDYRGLQALEGTSEKRKKSGKRSLKEMKGVKETVYPRQRFSEES